MARTSFKMGSDPELMLRDIKTKVLRSAIPVVPQGKGAGRLLEGGGDNRVLHDNVLIEFNTEPALNANSFVETIRQVLKGITGIVSKDKLELHLQASADYPEEELNCEEARAFGCEPDFEAWDPAIIVAPGDASFKPFRSAGGHLHVGMHENEAINGILDDDLGKIEVVKAMDIFCGIPSVFIDKDPTAAARRSLYGRAGCHRPKTYGVEYRALGNWWLRSPKHVRLVYQLTDHALHIVSSTGIEGITENLGGPDKIQEIINKSLVKAAARAFKAHINNLLDDDTQALVKEISEGEELPFYDSWGL